MKDIDLGLISMQWSLLTSEEQSVYNIHKVNMIESTFMDQSEK